MEELLKCIFRSEVDYLEIKKRLEDETDPDIRADYEKKLTQDDECITNWKSQVNVDFNSSKIQKLREDTLLEYTSERTEQIANLEEAKEEQPDADRVIERAIAEEQDKKDFQDALVAELIVEGEVYGS